MATTQSLTRKLAILPIRAYQLMVSPLFPPSCRHIPTCSQYMVEAIAEWGALKGVSIGMKRLAHCHPWGTSGYDPVPRKLLVPETLEETDGLDLQFEKRGGLIPVAIQEFSTGQILMQAYTNREAFDYTLAHGKAAFWSTSRNELWIKGATSGNTLSVDRILVDCDQDALVYQVTLRGEGVCHTIGRDGRNRKACFYRDYDSDTGKWRFIRGME
ncbi:membrane protein insertion efficiency factor YidD [Parapedobacter koreensis]|uniref:Putative membrane protein insertion efficiency factor n=1 Tax=Parapedobacter koreensis TaxID=332977 RepID=A0A1H7ID84_9SPHI|nr:membrane protein insertion efficiency factor YidD [Parapedobacter koreensis]SEK60466.1 phosphoribosyl-AMP cyclohydrolase [Parapedobacter koreensis]